jgi:hypothetical protein
MFEFQKGSTFLVLIRTDENYLNALYHKKAVSANRKWENCYRPWENCYRSIVNSNKFVAEKMKLLLKIYERSGKMNMNLTQTSVNQERADHYASSKRPHSGEEESGYECAASLAAVSSGPSSYGCGRYFPLHTPLRRADRIP